MVDADQPQPAAFSKKLQIRGTGFSYKKNDLISGYSNRMQYQPQCSYQHKNKRSRGKRKPNFREKYRMGDPVCEVDDTKTKYPAKLCTKAHLRLNCAG